MAKEDLKIKVLNMLLANYLIVFPGPAPLFDWVCQNKNGQRFVRIEQNSLFQIVEKSIMEFK